MPRSLRLGAALAVLTSALSAGAQQPPCSPYVNPLPPNYGAPYHAPKPCAQAYALRPPPPPPTPPPPAPAPAPEPACSRRCKKLDPDAQLSVFWEFLAVKVGSYDIRGSDADARTWGFLVALDPDVAVTSDYMTHRTTFYGALGGGSDGFEGHLSWRSRAGVRGYLCDDHGPFLRAGFGLEFLGNNKLYRSGIELPYAEAGYQLLNQDVWFELGATGGLVLGGRYFTGDHAERRIDTEPELGAQATLQLDYFRMHANVMRIFARQTGPGTPIDQASVELCLNPLGALLACAHGAFHRGDVELPDGSFRESTATYVGGTLGIGIVRTGRAL
jgi:hypothetical protein